MSKVLDLSYPDKATRLRELRAFLCGYLERISQQPRPETLRYLADIARAAEMPHVTELAEARLRALEEASGFCTLEPFTVPWPFNGPSAAA